jgi:hypothetical protein
MISNTRQIATRRFHWIEKKFEREPVFAEKYREFIDNYIKPGHLSRIPQSEQGRHPQAFFPQHAV